MKLSPYFRSAVVAIYMAMSEKNTGVIARAGINPDEPV
jgi:hypothetical protein